MGHTVDWTEDQWGNESISDTYLDALNTAAADYLDTHYPDIATDDLTEEDKELAWKYVLENPPLPRYSDAGCNSNHRL